MSPDSKMMELILDISDGCRFSCPGCVVERDNPYNEKDFERLNAMVKSYSDNGILPFDITIGPTDVLASSNLDEIFSHPGIAELVSRFETLVINTTLLHHSKDVLDKLAAYLERVMSGKWLRLNVPFDLKKVDNPRYIERLKGNLDYLISQLQTVRFYKLFLAINYDEAITYTRPGQRFADEVMRLYDIDLYPDIHIDIVTPHLRNGTEDLIVNDKFYRSFRGVVGIMDEIAHDERYKDRWRPIINELNDNEGDMRAYTYHRGKLYQHAFIQETMLVLNDAFDVGDNWDCQTLEALRLENTVNQMVGNEYSQDCVVCPHLNLCSNRMVLMLKDVLKESRCLSPLGYTTQVKGVKT